MNDENYANILEKNYPYTAQYIRRYGISALVNTFEIPAKYETPEKLYEVCIKENKKLEKIVKKAPEGVIL